MQQKLLYEYAIVRVVPNVGREEFVNTGVILFCKKQKFLRMLYHINEHKIRTLMPDADIEAITKNLDAFYTIAGGDGNGGPIACMDEAERFRWLTAVRSASIQTSRPHPGVCDDLDKALLKLFKDMIE